MIVEFRTYTLQPGSVATVEERFGQALPNRAKLSPLAAFWHTEVGPLNRIIHVWPYENFEERTRIRAESQKLEGWPPNIREFVTEQKSEIFPPVPHLGVQGRRRALRDPRKGAQGRHLAAARRAARRHAGPREHAGGAGRL